MFDRPVAYREPNERVRRQIRFLLIVVMVMVLGQSLSVQLEHVSRAEPDPAGPAEVIAAVNRARRTEGLDPLQPLGSLAVSAAARLDGRVEWDSTTMVAIDEAFVFGATAEAAVDRSVVSTGRRVLLSAEARFIGVATSATPDHSLHAIIHLAGSAPRL